MPHQAGFLGGEQYAGNAGDREPARLPAIPVDPAHARTHVTTVKDVVRQRRGPAGPGLLALAASPIGNTLNYDG